MEACLSIKVKDPDWLTCKKCLLGGYGKARRTVISFKKKKKQLIRVIDLNFNQLTRYFNRIFHPSLSRSALPSFISCGRLMGHLLAFCFLHHVNTARFLIT